MTSAPLRVFRDQQGGRVRLGTQLGMGGQGEVCLVDGQSGTVAKIYLKPPGREEGDKLTALVRAATPALTQVSAWPRGLLLDDTGALKGFLMPLVNAEFQELHLLYRRASRRQYFPDADWRFLIHVARNVTRAFGTLHQHGHLMGDVSSRNVMVSKDGTVRFIDTDSFQVREGTRVFTCPVGTAEFTPPELQGQHFGSLVRGEQHDLFGLALLLFHLLFEGRHPYSGVHASGTIPSPAEAIAQDGFAYAANARGVRPPPGALPLTSLHAGLQALFERAFAPRHVGRPTAQEWDTALADLTASLTSCKVQPSHVHDRRVSCPWCELDRQSGMKTSYPGGARRVDVEGELNRIWRGVTAVPIPKAPVVLPVQHQPDPLPLPALPQLQEVSGRSGAVTVLGTLLLLVVLYALLTRSVGVAVFCSFLAVLVFNRNSRANVVNRKRQHAAKVAVQQRFVMIKEAERCTRERHDLQEKLRTVEGQLQNESVARKYQEAVNALSTQRKDIRELALTEQDRLATVLQQEKRPFLEQFLSQQRLQPGMISGFGPALIQSLNNQGIYSALDIDANIGYRKGVGPKRASDLVMWRASLESYFPFDPAKVPPAKLQAVQVQMDQQRTAKLQQFEKQVQEVATLLPRWREQEERTMAAVTLYRTEILRLDLTLQQLQQRIQQTGA